MALQKERNHKLVDTLAAAAFLGTVTFGVHNMKALQGTANSNSELAAKDQNTHKQHIISGISKKSDSSNKKKATNNKKDDKNKNKDLSNLLASAASDVSKGSDKSAAIAKAADQAVNGNGDLLKQVASNTAKNKNNNPNLDKLEDHIIKDKLPTTPTQHNSKNSLESAIANSVAPKEPSAKATNSGNGTSTLAPSSAVPNNNHKVTPPVSSGAIIPTPTPTPSHSASVAPTPVPSSSASSTPTPTPTPSSNAEHSGNSGIVTPSQTPSHAGSSANHEQNNNHNQSGSNATSSTPAHPDGSITSVPHNGNYSVTINFVDSTGNVIAKSLPVSVQMNTDQKINDALTNQVQSQLSSLGLNNYYNVAANGLPAYIVQEKDGSLTYTVPLTNKNVPNTTGNGNIQGGDSNAITNTNSQASTSTPSSAATSDTLNITNLPQGNNSATTNTSTPTTDEAIANLHSINTAGIDLQ